LLISRFDSFSCSNSVQRPCIILLKRDLTADERGRHKSTHPGIELGEKSGEWHGDVVIDV
jgi:hypothetical protein